MSNDDRNLLDLTTQMSAWRSAGNDLWTADQLRLEAGAATRFIGNIDAALDTLRSQLAGAQGLQSWLANADVGQFVSATTTQAICSRTSLSSSKR